MLVNAPLLNQLSEPTADHLPDENRTANCVDASLASGVLALCPWLTDATVDGDALKDAVYGQGYTGATDPARFIAYLQATYGVGMAEVQQSSGAALVATIRAHLATHQPVTGAIPSLWGNSFAGVDMVHYGASTHEVLWCDDDGANLTAMNPWGGFWQKQPYAWWAGRIVYGRVFTMEGSMATPLDSYFTISSDGKSYALKSNPAIVLSGGELALFQRLQGATGLPVAALDYALQPKYYSGFAFRRYERAVVVYDPQHKKDSQPGFSDFYLGHVDDPDFGIASPPAAPAPKPAPVLSLYVDGVKVAAPYTLSIPAVSIPAVSHSIEVK